MGLLGDPADVAPFSITTNFDQICAALETGVTIIQADGLDLKINYGGLIGENTQVYSGGLKLNIGF